MSPRVAVVTGAARRGSIGRAIARRLLEDGLRVLISDVDRPLDTHPDYEVAPRSALAEAERDLSEFGDVRSRPCDVRRAGEVDELIAAARRDFGRLDVMVNNAGLGVGLTPAVDLDERDWQLNLDVMATGVFLCSRAAARAMIEQGGGGRIITIASQAGKSGMPLLSAYCAAKFAALGFTQALAHELGPQGITVNAVCPGTVDTPLLAVRGGVFDAFTQATGHTVEEYRRRLLRQIPLGRFAKPADIASAVSFLASPDAAYITGESINVTGGQEMH